METHAVLPRCPISFRSWFWRQRTAFAPCAHSDASMLRATCRCSTAGCRRGSPSDTGVAHCSPPGELDFAAHANAAREEMTLLAEDVLGLMATSALPAPRLEDPYVRAGMAR